MDVTADQHPFEFRRLAHELPVLGRRAELHDSFDAGAVVPGPVEQHDLAVRGQMGDITLEVPLRLFTLGWLFQSDHAGSAGIQMLGEAFDGAALAGGIPAFEDQDDFLAAGFNPVLQLQQFDLKCPLALLVLAAGHSLVVRVVLAPGLHRLPGRIEQYRVVIQIVLEVQLVEIVDPQLNRGVGMDLSMVQRHADIQGHGEAPTVPNGRIGDDLHAPSSGGSTGPVAVIGARTPDPVWDGA
ncbi:MAG: hypothetical protein JWN95_3775 [Frankiales bacterium]|nr:hypothetical protein [Frankiales bacterium]